MASFGKSDELRAATFRGVDLTGASFRASALNGLSVVGCEVYEVVIRGSEIQHLELDSPWLFEGDAPRLIVNGVDVLPLVDAELNTMFPGRAERSATTPEGLRSAFDALDRAWAAAIDRAAAMPPGTTDRSIGDEWSFTQTLRHLVLATDVWLNKAILGKEQPFHPYGLLFTGGERTGFDMTVFSTDEPDHAESLEAFRDRFAMVREYVERVTPDGLAAACANPWSPGDELPALMCVHTILQEGWEHLRYAVRDLDVIAATT